MPTNDIAFYQHETWQIDGVANNAAGQPIALSDLQFCIEAPTGTVLTVDKTSGVTLSGTVTGGYTILVPDNAKAVFNSAIPYNYFIRAVDMNGGKSIQNAGRFTVMHDGYPS